MRVDDQRAFFARLPGIVSALAALFLTAAPSFAQDADEGDSEEAVEAPSDVEEVVVTGSRLRRDTYTSIAPLQVITAEVSREIGLINAGDILQESTAASGLQIDLTFLGFVLDNGPGAQTIDLRGLGADRTLVLINGKRLAPSGVEGVPVAPDLGLVPGSLVQQYDLLLDGASSVYGSDAVAGVVNLVLRKDFNGLEMEAFSSVPSHSNGVENTLSVIWGKNFDRGFIGFGAEWSQSDPVTLADRPWTAGCAQHAEIDQFGQVRTQDLFWSNVWNMPAGDCRVGGQAGWISGAPFAGAIFHTPGGSNGGWPDFSAWSLFGVTGPDADGDGVADVNFFSRYNLNGNTQFAHLFSERETQNVMTYGEYTFAGEMNITPYFNALYSRRDSFLNFGAAQLFPFVPALNPFNICNPDAAGGVDCALAWNDFVNDPEIVDQVLGIFGCDPSAGGSCDQTQPEMGAVGVVPVVAVRGDRNTTDVQLTQYRVVGGVRTDLPFLTFGSLSDWSADFSVVYSRATGEAHRVGIRGDRLDLALGAFSTTNTPCENNTGAQLAADTAAGCVPVNMFAPSLYPEDVMGDFATAAEHEYLFDSRDFDTEYEQTLFTLYTSGSLFEIPGGTVAAGIGYEQRKDEINSIPDAVARDGLFFGFFSDGGAVGEKTTKEVFGEIELPLLANLPAAQELTLNLSARRTDDEFYGAAWTYSYKLGWRPVDSLLIRGTLGTSYRAPNLRELFLRDQTGFLNLFDPCLIPTVAEDPLTGAYIPENDPREQEVLDNCLANGVDPTVAVNQGNNVYSVEVAEGGVLNLDEEESESWSAGFAWQQPFTNDFEFSVSAYYYSIEINNTIIEPSAQFIINDCYTSVSSPSTFCNRIERDLSDPTTPLIEFIDQGFINRDQERARGMDVNLMLSTQFTLMERPIDFTMDFRANRQMERSFLFVDDEGNPDFDEDQGDFGYSDWKFRNRFAFDMDEWRFTWETTYISGVEQEAAGVDEFDNISGNSDTCLGPGLGDVNCRDIGFAGRYFNHNTSLYWRGDRWTFGGGIRNVFDQEPPFVDGTEVLSVNNAPIGAGYDLRGRTYFLNIAATFGGE